MIGKIVFQNPTHTRIDWREPGFVLVHTAIQSPRPVLYLAGPYLDRLAISRVGDQLIQRGYEISSSWLWNDHEVPEKLGGPAASYNKPKVARWLEENCAVPDLHDLDRAMTLIVFTCFSDNLSRGGHDFETGYAWAKQKLVVLVGPRRSVFHTMMGVTHFETLTEFLAQWLKGQPQKELG